MIIMKKSTYKKTMSPIDKTDVMVCLNVIKEDKNCVSSIILNQILKIHIDTTIKRKKEKLRMYRKKVQL